MATPVHYLYDLLKCLYACILVMQKLPLAFHKLVIVL